MKREEIYAAIVKSSGMTIFNYFPEEDRFTVLDERLETVKEVENFLDRLETDAQICPEDRQKAVKFFKNAFSQNILEIRRREEERITRKILKAVPVTDKETGRKMVLGCVVDITGEKKREELLEKQARCDALTGLYNSVYGKELINEYLGNKDPYASCGLMVVDIDYFKNVNDNFGHLFGDEALTALTGVMRRIFQEKDIIMRAGGDEFVILLKDIRHPALVKKAMQLVKSVRELFFSGNDYRMTCSVGVCFLPENISGYTYNQLFKNADWALYKSKENGRNRYSFCDNLQRFELTGREECPDEENIDARYLHGDIVSVAFEIFEKRSSFDAAVELLMKVIGIRFGLDRITIINTDIKGGNTSRKYQWTSPKAPQTEEHLGNFTRKDFLTLFRSYDEYGTTVLHYDNMGMYSEGAVKLLMQGGAKTVVYAAMYCEGSYTGAMSYVVCENKRYWSKLERSQLGELTKIVSAHLAKKQAMNAWHKSLMAPDYDELTGLLGFSRFREETERMIVGRKFSSSLMMYTDFVDFQGFNQKYGYSMGDQLLKEFSNYLMEMMEDEADVYFARIVSDQFVMFRPFEEMEHVEEIVDKINNTFVMRQAERFPDAKIRLRTGIYHVVPGCPSASAAIDGANCARKQIMADSRLCARLFREEKG